MKTENYYVIDRADKDYTGCNSIAAEAFKLNLAVKCKVTVDGSVQKVYIQDYFADTGLYQDVNGKFYSKIVVIKKKQKVVNVKSVVEIVEILIGDGYTVNSSGNWVCPGELTWNAAMFQYCGGPLAGQAENNHRWLDKWLTA